MKLTNRKISLKTALVAFLALTVFFSTVTYYVATSPTADYVVSPLGFVKTASYIIYLEGSTYYSIDGVTGTEFTSGSNKATVQQDTLTEMTEGLLFLKGNTLDGGISLEDDEMVLEEYQGRYRVYSNQGKFLVSQLTSDPSTSGWGSSEEGRWWYNTADSAFKYWNGTHINAFEGGAQGPQGPQGEQGPEGPQGPPGTPGGGTTEGEQPYSYMVFTNATSCYAVNGVTGGIAYSNTDGGAVINYAISNLPSGGGKVFVKTGLYNVLTRITDQSKNNVELHLEYGAILKAKNALNTDVIYISSVDNWWIHGGEIDGNKANQGDPNTYELYGVRTDSVDGFKVSDMFIHDTRLTGIMVQQGRDIEICGNRMIDNSWNGITVGLITYMVDVHDNYVEGSSDVGITIYGSDVSIHDNLIENIDGSDGYSDSRWGIGIEGNDPSGILICDNVIIQDTGASGIFGYVGANVMEDVVIRDNIIVTGNQAAIGFMSGLVNFDISGNHITGIVAYKWGIVFQDTGINDGIVSNNYFDGASNYVGIAVYSGEVDDTLISANIFDGSPQTGILLDGDSDDNTVSDNRFLGGTTGLQIDDSAGNNNRVYGNDFWDCSTDVVDNGTGTRYGDNIDQNGNWDEGVEP